MAEIGVTMTRPENFAVTVTEGDETTTFNVEVPPMLIGDKLGLKWVDVNTVIKETFVYLLERETTATLTKRFNLLTIVHIHPDYYEELHRRLAPLEQ